MKTSEMTACPFCNIPLDKSGKHFCTAVRSDQTGLPTTQAIQCDECQISFGDSASLTQHIKANHMQPEKTELERIIEVMAWAHEKNALHFKCPYFEILFPHPTEGEMVQKPAQPDIVMDNERAEAGLSNPDAVPFKNPIDDPDYYADAQDRFYNHQRK